MGRDDNQLMATRQLRCHAITTEIWLLHFATTTLKFLLAKCPMSQRTTVCHTETTLRSGHYGQVTLSQGHKVMSQQYGQVTTVRSQGHKVTRSQGHVTTVRSGTDRTIPGLGANSQTRLKLRDGQHLSLSYVMQ